MYQVLFVCDMYVYHLSGGETLPVSQDMFTL